jgi:hypothetical protein
LLSAASQGSSHNLSHKLGGGSPRFSAFLGEHIIRNKVRKILTFLRSSEFVESRKNAGSGGEGGIRTLDTVARMPHFECGAFDHSATSP